VHGRRATLRIGTGGGGNRGIARYYRNFPEHPAAHGLQRDRARKPMASRETVSASPWPPKRLGTVELARRPCGGIVRILRRLYEPPGGRRLPPCGGLGLSGGHGRRGARWNRALPARDRARSGWVRWNWLAASVGASSEFYEGSPSRREAAGCLRAAGSASLEAMGGGVHDGIGLCPLATALAAAGHGGTGSPPVWGALSEFYEGSPSRREAAGGHRRVARPLWRPWAAGCTTE